MVGFPVLFDKAPLTDGEEPLPLDAANSDSEAPQTPMKRPSGKTAAATKKPASKAKAKAKAKATAKPKAKATARAKAKAEAKAKSKKTAPKAKAGAKSTPKKSMKKKKARFTCMSYIHMTFIPGFKSHMTYIDIH